MKKTQLLFILLAGLLLAGCATEKKQRARALTFLYTHPQEAAAYCATTFPVRDSVGQPVTILKADNKDYTGQIDSLGQQIDSLNNKLSQDSAKAATGGQGYGQELSKYKSQLSTLKKGYDALKASYKPCKPEIQQVPVYRENIAQVISLRLQLSQLQDKYNNQEKDKEAAQGSAKWRLWALIAAGIAIVGLIYMYIKK